MLAWSPGSGAMLGKTSLTIEVRRDGSHFFHTGIWFAGLGLAGRRGDEDWLMTCTVATTGECGDTLKGRSWRTWISLRRLFGAFNR